MMSNSHGVSQERSLLLEEYVIRICNVSSSPKEQDDLGRDYVLKEPEEEGKGKSLMQTNSRPNIHPGRSTRLRTRTLESAEPGFKFQLLYILISCVTPPGQFI